MLVEACGAKDAQSLHHREAGPVDDRETLIREPLADRVRDFQVRAVTGSRSATPLRIASQKLSPASRPSRCARRNHVSTST